MELKKLTGPQAGSLKYDLLTALGAAGLHGSPTVQTSLMRLCTVITARYNWRMDEVSIGQAELARLWAVNERTVKREMKRLTQDGWIICLRPGVRGRVGAYRLNYASIYEKTQSSWEAVGQDFAERMSEFSGTGRVVKVDFKSPQPHPKVVPLSAVPKDGTGWAPIARRLQETHPELYENWFAKLEEKPAKAGELNLKAANAFVAGYIQTHLLKFVDEAVVIEANAANSPIPKVTITI